MEKILTYLALTVSLTSYASDVFVETTQQKGQGILRAIGNECFVYTPKHVTDGSADFMVSTRIDKRIKTELLTSYPQDLSVLKLPSDKSNACAESGWKDEGAKVSSILDVITEGKLNIRQASGRLVAYDIDIISKELHSNFRIRMKDESITIQQGMSGGIVTVGGYPIGMLLSTDHNSATVLRIDTIADLSRSVILKYATEKEVIELNLNEPANGASSGTKSNHVIKNEFAARPVVDVKRKIYKGMLAQGESFIIPILAKGNTAYRLHFLRDDNRGRTLAFEFQNPAKKLLHKYKTNLKSSAYWSFGTTEKGEHYLVVTSSNGAGSYQLELEEIATPEQLLSESNTLDHGVTVKGMIAEGTFSKYSFLSRGNTSYRLHSKKQNEPTRVKIELQNPAAKPISRGEFSNAIDQTWSFGTIDKGEHYLIVRGDKGSGGYELKMDVIATPEQQLSESNVMAHGDTVSGMIAKGTYARYSIMSYGNTAYRLHSKKQSDPTRIRLEFVKPGNHRPVRDETTTNKDVTLSFGTTEKGLHQLVVWGDLDSGSYELELEVIATPDQQTSPSNVLTVNDTAGGMIAEGTFTRYQLKFPQAGRYQLKSARQADDTRIRLVLQNTSGKVLSSEVLRTDRDSQWKLPEVSAKEAILLIYGDNDSGSYELQLQSH